MISDTQLAYLAGLLDADGSIDLRFRTDTEATLVLRAQVYNTDEELIDWLCLTFGGKKHKAGRSDQGNHWKQEFTWYLNGDRAVEMLAGILPYMHIKRARAALAIEAWEKRMPTPIADRRKTLPEGVAELRKGYVTQMREMNKKGRAS